MNTKKILSLLLALSMVFTMMVFPVSAEETPAETPEAPQETTEATEEATPYVCPLHPDAVWVELAEDSWNAGQIQPGETSHYRLVGEQTPSKVLTVAADTAICIDLNGYGFTGPSTNGVRVFEIAAGGTLTIMDSVGTGVITGGIHRSTNSSSNTSTDSWGRGGNIYNAGTVNLYSGTITDGIGSTGTVYGAAQGGNYFGATGSVLNVYGGTITNGKLTHGSYFNSETKAMVGGNIFSYGTVNISGGTISGGKVERTDSSTDKNRDIFCYGGNIGVVDGTLNITGGVITGGVITGGRTNNTIYGRNVRTFGGNIYTKNATVTFSNGEISDGTVRANVQTTGTTTAFIADVYANGGNIYAYGGSFTMTGGTISGGSLSTKIINQGETTKDKADVYYSRGGNAYFESCAITISGGLIDAGTATFTQDDDDTTQDTYGAGQGGNVFVGAGCTVNFSAGTISNGFAHSVGGNLFNNATFNMTGGQILDGSVTDTVNGYGTGGNLQNAKTFNMSGGLMSGGRAYYRGGNVYNAGTVAMSGGAVMTEGILNGYTTYTAAYGGNYYGTGVLKLYDNAVIKNGTAYNGGNICTATSNGDIYMYGGMIYGGYAHKYGPDVRIYNDDGCSLYMYGGFINNLNDGGTDNRIDLYNGVFKNDVSKFTTLQGATAMMSCAHYTKLANGYYNVWHAEGTCATCGHTYTNYGVGNTYTTSATEHLTLGGTHTYVDGVCSTCGLAEVAHTAACSHGCENVTWTPWDGVTLENGGHYYLTDNLVVANALTVSVANVCIDLNGYTLTAAPADRAFTMSNNCVLNLMDSSADNTGLLRSFGLTGEKSGGLLYVSSGGTMTLYDLTVANGSTTGDRGGNIYVYGTEATLVVNNAKILNGTLLGATDRRGGNICAYYKANVVIKGADTYIANGWAYGGSSNCYGGNIHLGQGCDLYIYDGLIEGGVAANGANLSVVNGKESDGQKGYFYMYGGTIGGNGNYENGKPCTTNSIRISQSSSNTSDMFMYGGTIAGTISADGTVGEVYIYAGKVKRNPLTLDNNYSALGKCACFTYDAKTGFYTVSHINTAPTCANCAGNDAGFAKGYGDAHIFEYVTENVTATLNGTAYTDLTAALAVAGETDAVIMHTDVAVDGDVDVYCVVDLNGHSLTATGVISAENSAAVLKDTVGTGTMAAAEGIKTQPDNGMLVIDAENNGTCVLETVEVVQKTVKFQDAEGNEDKDKVGIKFYIDKAAAATKLDDAITAGSNVKIRLTVSWGDNKSHSFVYNDELVQKYLADWDNKIFTCQIVGLEKLGEYGLVAEVVSNGVVVAAYEFGTK